MAGGRLSFGKVSVYVVLADFPQTPAEFVTIPILEFENNPNPFYERSKKLKQ